MLDNDGTVGPVQKHVTYFCFNRECDLVRMAECVLSTEFSGEFPQEHRLCPDCHKEMYRVG